jgi:hypothetical protein
MKGTATTPILAIKLPGNVTRIEYLEYGRIAPSLDEEIRHFVAWKKSPELGCTLSAVGQERGKNNHLELLF